MRADQLASPGILSNSQQLRHQSAHAISRAEINLSHGVISTSDDLQAFFTDCVNKLTAAEAAAKPDATATTVSIDDNTLTVGQQATVDVIVKNAAGNPIAGVPVTWSFDPTSTAAGRTIVGSDAVSGSGGHARCTISSTTTGTMVVDADIAFLGVSINETVTATVA